MAAFTIELRDVLKRHDTEDVDQLSDFLLSGSVTLGGPDPDPTDSDHMNIISTDEAVKVNFKWKQTGVIWRLLDNDLKWECRVFVEKMGPGDGPKIEEQKVKFNRGEKGGPFVVKYAESIRIGGSAVSLDEGLYIVSATLMLKGPSGEPTRIAAFADLGRLQVFNASS